MTRALIRRVEKLEQTMVTTAEARTGKGHWLISEKGEDRKAKEAALRASAAWTEGDWITRWVVVDPPQRDVA
jgi:hypothetical protein